MHIDVYEFICTSSLGAIQLGHFIFLTNNKIREQASQI